MFSVPTTQYEGGIIIKKQYFTRFPNKYIQCNIKNQFGISRKFYITYILIDRYRSYEDFSWITIRKILNFYGYKTFKNRPKAVDEILDILEYMINNEMIEIAQDLDSLSYDTGIEIKINSEKFDYPNKFTKLESYQLDHILTAETSLNKENILMAFLYINSYIGCRKKTDNGTELENPQDNPEAFWQSLNNMASNLGVSKSTINQCIKFLTSSNNGQPALLVKHEVANYDNNDNVPVNHPAIYVLNKEGYQNEIKWAVKKMLEIYDIK